MAKIILDENAEAVIKAVDGITKSLEKQTKSNNDSFVVIMETLDKFISATKSQSESIDKMISEISEIVDLSKKILIPEVLIPPSDEYMDRVKKIKTKKKEREVEDND